MLSTIRRIALVVLVLGALTQPRSPASEIRTWSDASGKFSVKAKFVSVADGKVTLRQEDGDTLEIELAKLSAADQKYVADQKAAADNPFKKKTDTPVASKSDAPEPAPTSVDWSAAKIIDVNPVSATWKLPAIAVSASDAKPGIIRLPPKAAFFEQVRGLAINAAGQRAAISYVNNDPREKAGSTRMLSVDVTAGKVVGTANVPGKFAPLALSDDGNRVLVRRDEFAGDKQDLLELWALEGSGIRKLARWIAYDDAKGGERAVAWAAFLADGRLATCSQTGRLAVWELDPPRPVYQLTIKRDCVPGLSPDRKLIAFATDKELGVLDAAAGQALTTHEMPQMAGGAFAFRPDGRKLACAGYDRVLVWDVASGEVQRDMPLRSMHVGGKLAWAGDNFLLVGRQTLVDPEQQIRLWDYQGGEASASAGGLHWFVVSEGDRAPGGLVGAKLPQETVLARLKSALAEPDFFVVKPGVTVTIDVIGVTDENQREKVAAALKAKVEANGGQVSDDGTITLKASTERGKEREVSYHTFGMPFRDRTYKVREFTSKVQFVYQGKTAWQAAVNNIPFFVRLGENETMEQYLKKHEKANYEWFEKVELPKLLTKPTGSPGLGSSRVTPAGLR
jgi:WD40 repeat protein